MVRRVLYFGNPAHLSLREKQLEIRLKENGQKGCLSDLPLSSRVPVEDIGMVVLDSPGITLTASLLSALVENNCAVLSCDKRHLPSGLLLSLSGNVLQSERSREQVSASLPLKKQLWQQTVSAKIRNQAKVLQSKGLEAGNLLKWADSVKSGDSRNMEARAAVYYWSVFFYRRRGFCKRKGGCVSERIVELRVFNPTGHDGEGAG